MKKLLILSGAISILTATVNAQITPVSTKTEIKSERRVESELKKERVPEQKELGTVKNSETYNSQGANNFWGSLPVHETYVPKDVLTKLTDMFGLKLYDITAIKGPDNQDEYVVRIMQHGQMDTKTITIV